MNCLVTQISIKILTNVRIIACNWHLLTPYCRLPIPSFQYTFVPNILLATVIYVIVIRFIMVLPQLLNSLWMLPTPIIMKSYVTFKTIIHMQVHPWRFYMSFSFILYLLWTSLFNCFLNIFNMRDVQAS